MNKESKNEVIYAVNTNTDRNWVEICDTRVSHINGVGDPVARVTEVTLAHLIVGLLTDAIATPPGQVRNAPHPDALRLEHLVEMDHCTVQQDDGDVEVVQFIFERSGVDTIVNDLRAALDRSIVVMASHKERRHGYPNGQKEKHHD